MTIKLDNLKYLSPERRLLEFQAGVDELIADSKRETNNTYKENATRLRAIAVARDPLNQLLQYRLS
jgi:hypothetical protein